MGWLFDPRVRELFRRVDPYSIEVAGLDPLGVLNSCPASTIERLASDTQFVTQANELLAQLQLELDRPPIHPTADLPLVAYLSPEFGFAASVPQYSGGLGVLAGDYLKAAADLHLPIVGVGLLYRSGYFRQVIDANGRQNERLPMVHPAELGLTQVNGTVMVPLGDHEVGSSVWRADIGDNHLYLLDTCVPGEMGPDQLVNDRLYGGGSEDRIRQELLLGIGGYRALKALGIEPKIYHLNEGHAGFVTLERIREMMTERHVSFAEAIEMVRPSLMFTTHTPVPAGIDRFSHDLIRKYFGWWCQQTGVSMEELLALGNEPEGDPAVFNLAHMSLRLSGQANGVAKLHGEVSREMFHSLWPNVPYNEIPIGSVTNGVHAPTFMSDEIQALLTSTVGDDWQIADHDRFKAVHAAEYRDLWHARTASRNRLVNFIRHRDQSKETLLSPEYLTIGFARRFATYKRATLLLNNPERLQALLTSDRPIQLVFAGKAHPADEPGKELLHDIVELTRDPAVRHRVAFVEDYDLDAGRMLTQGVDVWLNNPLRPMEACGTSGMKAALNGVLNLSVRDGWWDEAYHPNLGWAIPTVDHHDPHERDRLEANGLYDLIEHQLVPLFYDRNRDGIPMGWVDKMANCLQMLVPQFHAGRMVSEYTSAYYVDAARRVDAITGDNFSAATRLAHYRRHVTAHWSNVRVNHIETPVDAHSFETIQIRAEVDLGELEITDVEVQFATGPVLHDQDLDSASFSAMRHDHHDPDHPGIHHFVGEFACQQPGTMGCAVRVVPHHPDQHHWTDFGLVTWANSEV